MQLSSLSLPTIFWKTERNKRESHANSFYLNDGTPLFTLSIIKYCHHVKDNHITPHRTNKSPSKQTKEKKVKQMGTITKRKENVFIQTVALPVD